jgi:hypothetical protein
VIPSRARAAAKHWERWVTFCRSHYLDPFLFDLVDLVPILQVFVTRYRSGTIAPRGQPVRAGTVDDTLCGVGEGFARMGARNIHKIATGDIYFHIQRQIRGWEGEDNPQTCVKPPLVQIHMVIVSLAFREHHSEANQAIADMTTITLFYLLWPGEYTGTTNDGVAFRLCNLQQWVGNQAVDVMHATESQLLASTSASLVFTTQKDGVQGGAVNHACSEATHCCPVMALFHQVIHL